MLYAWAGPAREGRSRTVVASARATAIILPQARLRQLTMWGLELLMGTSGAGRRRADASRTGWTRIVGGWRLELVGDGVESGPGSAFWILNLVGAD
jgi:hypothetical protein